MRTANKRGASGATVAVRVVFVALFCLAFLYSRQSGRPASISISIRDAETGKLTPVRVSLVDAQGNRPHVSGALGVSDSAIGIPPEVVAVMYGPSDRAQGFLLQPDGSFYVDGKFSTQLPAGTYTLTISKGYEFVSQTATLALTAGQSLQREYKLRRWIDMPKRGWYSGDDHIHLRRSPRDNPAILRWIAAEDIHVGNLLQMGDFWATFFSQYGWGEEGRYREGDYILSSGQEEPRTPEIGHTISLGAREFVRDGKDYYSYDRIFDRVHELGGVTGFAHEAVSFHGYRGLTLNVLRGKIDFLELMQFCVTPGPLAPDHYYHYLDLGYKLTALAGSDFPWCGRGPRFGLKQGCSQIGDARFYTYTGGPLSFDGWLAGVKAGHTFVTTGPMLELTVNNHLPGDTLDVKRGTSLRISARAYGQESQIPLQALEIVAHGETLKKTETSEPGQGKDKLSLDLELPADHGMWIAARAGAGPAQIAFTTPVYVTVEGGGFHNPKSAGRYLDLSEKYLGEIEDELANPGKNLDNQAARGKESLERQITDTRKVLRDLTARLQSDAADARREFPGIPSGYLRQAENIPDFWISTVEGVNRFLDQNIRKGVVTGIGTTAGGRAMRAVFYGQPREGKGTTTFSGSLGFRDVRAYIGPDYRKKVYVGLASVHGGEFEGIVGIVNLLSVLETGKDLRGKAWPEIVQVSRSLDRIILVPITNVDGRARVPLRMERFRGTDDTVHEYFNTGGRKDGKNIGWPECKEFIPLDFSKTQFPGGYPNDAGVNIQHDDFFGRRQPETQALFELTARERPDLILNMHTGAVYPLMHRPFAEAALMPAFEELFRRVQTRLAVEKLQASEDPSREADPERRTVRSPYNLDSALNLHCGALSVVIESPSHGFTSAKRNGKEVIFTPDDLVNAQLLCHLEAMKYLAETGGRYRWAPGKSPQR